jgi:cation-transporting ATPase I
VAGGDAPVDEAGRKALLVHAQRLAAQGLRVLLVAQGQATVDINDPQGLTAQGFVGIGDPLRTTVKPAVQRCQQAGVRVIMLTGDHPATARSIARDAGLLSGEHGDVFMGSDLADLENGELDARMERAAVIARATPLDKLRIIESLRRRGHVVAMTGDGVNDAPALRLADVGIAMGHTGTEVARQAADVVLANDDFATLVESLVEGRGFWKNMRRAMGLLLGGNLGELGLIVGASLLGQGSPLNTRQILAVNLITDALPAFAVVIQQPNHRDLKGLAREGPISLDDALRLDVIRRAVTTALPSLGAYMASRYVSPAHQHSTVAFGSIIATQLAQTLDLGRADGRLSVPVCWAVLSSAGLLGSCLLFRAPRNALRLALPTPASLVSISLASAVSSALGRHLLPDGHGLRRFDHRVNETRFRDGLEPSHR